jgi:HK97 family phage prohead protease
MTTASANRPSSVERKRAPVRIAAKALADDGTFEGYGSIFKVVDSVGDVVMPGAYADTIAAHTKASSAPKLLWQHDANEPIGVWTEMAEDDRGLWMKGRLILDVARAREAHALMKAGAIDGLSIGFEVAESSFLHPDDALEKYGWTAPTARSEIRMLHKVNLWEVSVVTFPACEPARVSAVKTDPAAREYQPVIAALARRQRAIDQLLSRVI